jgi:propanediol dehydratase small subunit
MSMESYPISQNMDLRSIKSKTGKSIDEITINNILSGNISSEDIKISREVLKLQGNIAEKAGRPQLKENFDRAAELVDIPDKVLLQMYDKLRPNRSTKEELLAIASELENRYGALNCSRFVLEAAEVYEKRGILK